MGRLYQKYTRYSSLSILDSRSLQTTCTKQTEALRHTYPRPRQHGLLVSRLGAKLLPSYHRCLHSKCQNLEEVLQRPRPKGSEDLGHALRFLHESPSHDQREAAILASSGLYYW